jgi:hypothetical protein
VVTLPWDRLISRVRARVARSRESVVPGAENGHVVDIDRLICPLRYDLRIRIDFIRLLRDEWPLYAQAAEQFLERPESVAYYVWFKEVRCARYHPELYRNPERLKAAFLDRIRKTAGIWKSITDCGYDLSRPIRLESGHSIKPVHGKSVQTKYFAGDGCHRLAALYVMGRTRLQPADYEVRIERELEPLDITAILLKQLPLDQSSYLSFISHFYCDGVQLASAERIVQHVASHRPDLLPELESVLAFDLSILRTHD